MGMYVEPKNGDKLEWCMEHGTEMVEMDIANVEFNDIPDNYLPIVLVDNFNFYALGVGYDEREFKYFRDTVNDPRPKRWFLATKEDLKQDCPMWDTYMEGE